MTPSYQKVVEEDFVEAERDSRRYEKGTIDQRLIVRVEGRTEGNEYADALLCWQSNSAEFDTRGTAAVTDDVFIQDDLAVVSFRIPMKRVNGIWLQDGIEDGEADQCVGVF